MCTHMHTHLHEHSATRSTLSLSLGVDWGRVCSESLMEFSGSGSSVHNSLGYLI